MGRWEARLACLLFCIWLSSSLAAESFTDCFPTGKISPLISSILSLPGNPYIYNLGFAKFYSFSFDNSAQGLGIENVSLARWDSLRSSILPSDEAAFSQVASSLQAASDSLEAAKAAQKGAHLLSSSAQAVSKGYSLSVDAGGLNFSLFFEPYSPISVFLGASKLWHLPELAAYTVAYPAQYQSAVSNAASAYDSLNEAALASAEEAQVKYALVKQEGAGSAEYSGAAKEGFLRAQAMLSSPRASFCSLQRGAADAIEGRLEEAPPIPDFGAMGFGGYMQRTGGRGANSSLSALLSAYAELSAAEAQMQAEYASAELSAQSSLSSLSSAISSLDKEELQLIGDSQLPYQKGPIASVGTSFSGILRGLQQARSEKGKAESLLAAARGAKAARSAQGYLATAISEASEAALSAKGATSSLADVRRAAEEAVAGEKSFAQQSIEKAEQKLSAPTASLSGSKAMLSATASLEEAKKAFSSADFAPSLGGKYAAYSLAAEKAEASLSHANGVASAELTDAALSSISSLRSLLGQAQSDGLDVSFEMQQLQQLQSLLDSASAGNGEMLSSLLSAISSERKWVILRLEAKYASLPQEYEGLRADIGELRQQDPSFLPEFESLSEYFGPSGLDTETAAGHLHDIGPELADFRVKVDKKIPDYLSSLLSSNAQVLELSGQAVLGKQGDYSLTVSTANPSSFSYGGQLELSVSTRVPVFSSDFLSGDRIVDAYSQKGATIILVPGAQAGQAFTFSFSKKGQPAQVTSSTDECASATQEAAQARRHISFFASREMDSLLISEQAPAGASSAQVKYAGSIFQLQPAWAAAGMMLEGAIGPVAAGQNTLEIGYLVSQPFTVSQGERSYGTAANGARKVSYAVSLGSVSVGCNYARIELSEPYAVSGFTATQLSGAKVSQSSSAASPGGSLLSFTLSPLQAGAQEQVAISYEISDAQSALASALSQAELQVLYYNRSRDIASLSQARLLAAQNRTEEALSLLSQMRKEGRELSASFADYQQFLSENSSATALLSFSLQAQSQLSGQNLTAASAQLALIASKLSEGLAASSAKAQDGDYAAATASARKAASDYRTALASLAWKAASDASDAYAKARQSATQDSLHLVAAQQAITDAQSLFAQGSHLGSFIRSSEASAELTLAAGDISGQNAASAAQLSAIQSRFASLRNDTSALLSQYSSQYAVLSSQSKRQLPITPSEAQGQIDDADKALSAALKPKPVSQQALLQANSSCQQLLSTHTLLQNSIWQIRSSSESSLQVARLAAAEAQGKAQGEEALQIKEEVSRAEGFYAAALYADSLVSSERAISAANLLLAKSAGGIDAKAALLAAVSFAFVAAAAYYFFSHKGKGRKKERKAMPKAET